jgi:hypothetical protein
LHDLRIPFERSSSHHFSNMGLAPYKQRGSEIESDEGRESHAERGRVGQIFTDTLLLLPRGPDICFESTCRVASASYVHESHDSPGKGEGDDTSVATCSSRAKVALSLLLRSLSAHQPHPPTQLPHSLYLPLLSFTPPPWPPSPRPLLPRLLPPRRLVSSLLPRARLCFSPFLVSPH